MERTRQHFSHDFLLNVVCKSQERSFKGKVAHPREQFSDVDSF